MTTPKASYWIKSGTYSLLHNLSSLLFGFGGFYILVRLFTKEDFGVWMLFITIAGIVEMIRQSLLRNGLIKFLAGSKTEMEEKEVRSASLMINILITLVIILLILLLSNSMALTFDSPELVDIMYLYCFTSICLIPLSQFEYLLQARFDFRGVFLTSISRNGIYFTLILLGALGVFEITLIRLSVLYLLAAITGSLSGLVLTRKHLSRGFSVSWARVRALFHYGKFVLGTGLGAIVNTSVDQFMIGSIISTASVAVYSSANKITTLINMPSTVLANIVFPQSAKLSELEDTKALRDLFEKSTGINMAIIVPSVILVLVFPEIIINIITGEKYLDAIPVLQVMVLFTLFIPFARLFGTILDSMGHQRVNFYMTSISALSNVGLNYFLIKAYGVMGALYGTLLVLILGFIVMQALLQKYLGFSYALIAKNALNLYPYLFNKIFRRN